MNAKDKNEFEIIFKRLCEKFNDQQIISIADAAPLVGFTPKSCRTMLRTGKFPVSTIQNGGRRMFRIIDVARYLVSPCKVLPPAVGRPCKVAAKVAAVVKGGAK